MESEHPTVKPSPWPAVSREHAMFERMRELTGTFERAAILDSAGAVIALAAPDGDEPRRPALFEGILASRPGLVTVSDARGTSTLLALPDDTFLWCEFPASVLVGEVFATMALLGPPRASSSLPPAEADAAPAALKRSGKGRTEAVLERELEDPNVEGAFAVDRALRRMHFASRDNAASATTMELVKRGGELASRWLDGQETEGSLRIFVEQRLTLFGSAIGRQRSTWLAYTTQVPRGAGFAAIERLAELLSREREHTTLSFGAVRPT